MSGKRVKIDKGRDIEVGFVRPIWKEGSVYVI